MTFSETNWLALGGVAAIVAAGWKHIMAAWEYVRGLCVVVVQLHDTTAVIVMHYLLTRHRKLKLGGSRIFESSYMRRRVSDKVAITIFEQFLEYRWLLFIRGRPLLCSKKGGKGSNNQPAADSNHTTLSFIRGTVNFDKLIAAAMEAYRQRILNPPHDLDAGSRFSVETFSGNMWAQNASRKNIAELGLGQGSNNSSPPTPAKSAGYEQYAEPVMRRMVMELYRFVLDSIRDFGITHHHANIDNLALPAEALQVVAELEQWLSMEQWYRDRSIPWRRGIMLIGKPGYGKTSFLRALAAKLDVPVFVFDLSYMDNEEFKAFWKQAGSASPAMVVFEDFDNVYNGRTSVLGKDGGSLTFDTILNAIDGLQSAHGIILAITTNRPEMIDPALGVRTDSGMASRPGRIDRIIELKELTYEGRLKIAKRILRDSPEEWEPITQLGTSKEDSGAQFEFRCVERAQQILNIKFSNGKIK